MRHLLRQWHENPKAQFHLKSIGDKWSAVDYPFSTNKAGRAFLDSAAISEADRAKIAHGNAERLLRL